VPEQTSSEAIRQYVLRRLIEPARRRGGAESSALSDRPFRALGELRGLSKQLFAELGGGEAFVRQMRERFFEKPSRRR
jgi:hypothetical protein